MECSITVCTNFLSTPFAIFKTQKSEKKGKFETLLQGIRLLECFSTGGRNPSVT